MARIGTRAQRARRVTATRRGKFQRKNSRRTGTSATGAKGDPEEEDEGLTWLCAAVAGLRHNAATLTPDLRLEEEFQEAEQNSSWTFGIGE